MIEPCERHEIINCGACKPQVKRSLPPDSHSFSAKYPGFCRVCRDDIDEGESVVYRFTEEWEGVIHESCR